MSMFEQQHLNRLLDLHDRSYRLLRWLNKGLRENKVKSSSIHESMNVADATKDWLKRQSNNLPADLRPGVDEVEEFSYLLASYLQTSFELKAGKVPGDWCGCRCLVCSYVRDAVFLHARKVTDGARETAQNLKVLCLEELANSMNLPLVSPDIEAFIKSNPNLGYAISVLTYTKELMRRTTFASQGLGVLALWREIAWSSRGPSRNFKLSTELVLDSKAKVAEYLQKFCDDAMK